MARSFAPQRKRRNIMSLLLRWVSSVFGGKKVRRSDIKLPIKYGSLEHACVHEAGHVMAALNAGANVVEVEIYPGPPPYGRTLTDRTDAQRRDIAVGGFGIERRLWEQNDLALEDGSFANEKQMLDKSSDNAARDKVSFFQRDFARDGVWPHDLDLEFMKHGQKVGRTFDLDAVLAIASALASEKYLDGSQVLDILK